MKIDVQYVDRLNEIINNSKEGNRMLEELKNKVEALLGGVQEVQTAVSNVAEAPNVEKAIVEAVIAALEAQGYTVTSPSTPEEQAA